VGSAGVVYYELLQPSKTITGDQYRFKLMRVSRALKEKRLQYEQRHDKVIFQYARQCSISCCTGRQNIFGMSEMGNPIPLAALS